MMRMFLRSIAFVIPILLNLFVTRVESQAQAFANGKIAFASNRSGQPQIYTIDRNGSNLQQLTFNSGSSWHPSWSGDGRQIAFVSDWANAQNDIFVMGADDSNIRNITNTPEVVEYAPDWLPDGHHILYEDAFGTIVIAKIRTDQPEDFIWLLHLDANNDDPRWSPNDQQIVYQQEHNIFVGSVAEGEPLQLPHSASPTANIDPDWQPLPLSEMD